MLAAPMAELEHRWRAAIGADASAARPAEPPPTRDPARGRTDHGARVRLAVAAVHDGPPLRPGSDLVSESGDAGRHRGRPRSRRRHVARRPRDAVRGRRPRGPRRGPGPGAAGPVDRRPRHRPSGRGRRGPASGSSSCRRSSAARRSTSIRDRDRGTGSRRSGRPVEVRDDLRRAVDLGPDLARPASPRSPRPGSRHRPARTSTRCPHCASARVVMDSAFGPTQCRMLYYCRACRQPFEALKTV